MRKLGFGMLAVAAALVSTASPALAATTMIDMTGNMADNGTYGNTFTLPATNGTLQMKVTGWQADQSTNRITSAWVGAYSPGTGVTGLGDLNGSQAYHQIDNAGGYTDFLLLQFNAPVAITAVNLSSFLMGSATTKDNDFALYAANVATPAWNSSIDLSVYRVVPSLWTTVADSGADGQVSTGVTTLSSQWLLGAAFDSGNNDGFKVRSLTLSTGPSVTAVPEPATWGMMILGMGMVGGALRRRRATAVASAA